jgi:predicted nucleotidyltransferase
LLSESQIIDSARKILKVTNPSRIILFGSYARGEASDDSDLDLLVIVKNTEKRGDRW